MQGGLPCIIIQFIKPVVAAGFEYSICLPDEEPASFTVRFHYQRHLPRFRKEVVVQPGIIMGEKNAHMWVGMVPTDDDILGIFFVDFFALHVFVDCACVLNCRFQIGRGFIHSMHKDVFALHLACRRNGNFVFAGAV